MARSQNLMWGWPGCAALSLMGMIVFKTDSHSHIPSQDQRLRSPAEEALKQELNEASEQTGIQPFPFRGDVCSPPIQDDLEELNLHPQLLWAGGSAEGRIIPASPADGF